MRIYLNGYWDIVPLFSNKESINPGIIRHEDFIKDVYRVPGIFSNPNDAGGMGIFNFFDYPGEWNKTVDAWIKKEFIVSEKYRDKKVFLHFGAILGSSRFWVNDFEVGGNVDPGLPIDLDITRHVKFDESNQILIRVSDIPRDEKGRALYPNGGVITSTCAGIWQDVYIEIKEAVYIKDYTYITSYRDKKAGFTVEVANDTCKRFRGTLFVLLKDRGAEEKTYKFPLDMISSNTGVVTFEMDAQDFHFWSSECPYLYDFEAGILNEHKAVVDSLKKKIGFKEIWIEGPHFYVNGKITHLYGEWGHRVHPYQQRPEYIRCWFNMLKDLGMNYVRLHTGPHDPVVYDMANEMGIYICAETALFGSSLQLAPGHKEFWENAFEHTRRFVQRDRNQACIVLWSAGNEMRWTPPTHLTIKELPKIKDIIDSIDPTRPVYFEGDSSLWNESTQDIISRHYGPEVTGEGWWDKTRPLHIGEMGKWHYGQPPENVMLGGNRAYESLWDAHAATGREAALLIERARINDVSCLFPWNIFCLDNPAVPDRDIPLTWESMQGPHPKPVKVPAYSSEFYWWEEQEPKYLKGSSFEMIKEALRPETVFIWERQCEYYVECPVHRKVTVLNDTEQYHKYELIISVREQNGRLIEEEHQWVELIPGDRKNVDYKFKTRECHSSIEFRVSLKRDGICIADKSQNICVKEQKNSIKTVMKIPPIKVIGDGSLNSYFNQRSITCFRVNTLEELTPEDILIVEKNAVREEQSFVNDLSKFILEGGRVLLMEQYTSIFKDMEIKTLNVIKAHPQCSWLEGLELSWWGEKAILGGGGQDYVAEMGYAKPVKGNFCSWVDVGTGDFGTGGLAWSALLEMRVGKGVLIANTLELSIYWDKAPSAGDVLDRILSYLIKYEPKENKKLWIDSSMEDNAAFTDIIAQRSQSVSECDVIFIDGSKTEWPDISGVRDLVCKGAAVIITGITPDTKIYCEKIIESELILYPLEDESQGVLSCRNAITEGVSNEELFWMNRISYAPADTRNFPLSNGYSVVCEKMRPIVTITRDKAYHELVKNYGTSELYRSKMFPMFGKEDRKGMLVGEAVIGKGRIIICQILLPFEEEKRTVRLWSILLGNLGVVKDKNLLGIKQEGRYESGYPGFLNVMKNYTQEHHRIITTFKRNTERMETMPELSIGEWEKIQGNEGQFILQGEDRFLCISYIISPRPRKMVKSIGGLPNPSFTTSLEINGSGEAEIFLNGKNVFAGVLKKDRIQIVPELELEKGTNALYLLLKEVSGEPLTICWKNIGGRNEHEFNFM